MQRIRIASLPGIILLAVACSDPPPPPNEAHSAFQVQLLAALDTAKPGAVIEIPPGVHRITRSLALNTDAVTLRGAGMHRSVLSFTGQIQGAEGLMVNGSDVLIEDFAIEDSIGDAFTLKGGRNVVIRRVRAEWNRAPDSGNGAYGLYLLQVENLLLEDCVAIGGSHAGIYVGQSRNVVLRNNRAEFNVAGIEIQNTVGADVHGNLVTNNTAGILVFNVPNLPRQGHSTRVYDNRIVANNIGNFAPSGTAVSGLPSGTGILVNASDRVEIFDNDIAENATANIILSSYFTSGFEGAMEVAADYDPYPEAVYIYGNRFAGGGDAPATLALKTLRVAMFGLGGSLPDILWDGYANPDKTDGSGRLQAPYAICVDNEPALLLNADMGNNSAGVTTDMTAYRCAHEKLPPIRISRAERRSSLLTPEP
ncbi:MAG: parallel beta-helix domain-containing protein [Gammaproteobacteria bacterium]